MARERKGFIVSRVATVEYIDAEGQHHKVTKDAKVQGGASKTNNLTDTQKLKLKLKHVGRIGKGDAGNYCSVWIGGIYLFSAKLTTDRASVISYANSRFGTSSS